MAAKAWKRASVLQDKRLTEDRKSLIERYQIDAAEAQLRAQRAAEENARQAAAEEKALRAVAEEEARRAAEEEAKRATAEEQARRAVEEEALREAEEQATRAAAKEEAKRAAEDKSKRATEEKALRAAAKEAAKRATEESKRATHADVAAAATPPVDESPVEERLLAAGRPVADLWRVEPPLLDPLVADEAAAATRVAEPREQAAELAPATALPIYGWFGVLAKVGKPPDSSSS